MVEATVKGALAAGLGGDVERIREAVKIEREVTQEVLGDAVDDGLVTIEGLVALGIV
jgi:hypothetical protein